MNAGIGTDVPPASEVEKYRASFQRLAKVLRVVDEPTSIESEIDLWIRQIIRIGSLVGVPVSNPVEVADAVEKRLAGEPAIGSFTGPTSPVSLPDRSSRRVDLASLRQKDVATIFDALRTGYGDDFFVVSVDKTSPDHVRRVYVEAAADHASGKELSDLVSGPMTRIQYGPGTYLVRFLRRGEELARSIVQVLPLKPKEGDVVQAHTDTTPIATQREDRSVEPKSEEAVDHPRHYNSSPSGVEAIDVVEWMTFSVGNAVKYCFRAGLKPGASAIEDIRKAIWYLQREVARLTKIDQLAKVGTK